MQVNEKQKMLEAILSRASIDPQFRRRLLEDPRAAIREAFGLVIPHPFRIRFVERDPDVDALIVLPDLQAQATDELPEDELQNAGGGWTAAPRGPWDRN